MAEREADRYSTSTAPIIVPQTNAVPYIQTYTASVQVALGHNFSTEVDYVGQHGIHLFSPQQNRNVPPLDVVENYIQQGVSFGVTSASPYGPSTAVPGSGLQAGPGNVSFLNSLNPYPQQANNQILTTFARDSSSIYNALYVSGRRTSRVRADSARVRSVGPSP